MSTVAASAIAYRAQRISGILGTAGRGASPEDDSDTLLIFNSLLDSLKLENLLVWATVRSEFDTVSSQQSYTIGTGGDWDIARPEKINLAGWIFTNNSPQNEVPIETLNTQQWAALTPKGQTSTISTKLYFEPFVREIAPFGRVNLWPIPLGSWKVALYLWQMLQEVASLATQMELPAGYQKMLEYNLAVELALQFPERQKMAPGSADIARKAKAAVKQMNAPDLLMRCDPGAMGVERRGGYRIRSNSYSDGNY